MEKSISLKWNAIANFIGLAYTTIIGIIILPLYIQYLGPESFGLVGFFIVLQSWMLLLDLGMSPMLSRQAAAIRGKNESFSKLKKLVRSLEIIVFIFALIAVVSIVSGSHWIADNWLNVMSLSLTKVSVSIALMGAIIGFRLFVSLYSGGVQGMENQVRLNVFNVVISTLRYGGALLLFHFVTQDVVYYFVYQLCISTIELVVISYMFYGVLPSTEKIKIGFYWDTLKPILPFSAGIAYATIIWILVTQLDKLILSNILTLSEYGYFALVAIVSAGIMKITSPISQAILPRLTHFLTQGDEKQMLVLYRKSTQIMTVIMAPVTGMVAMFSTELLYAWTGDRQAAEWAGPVLFWFVLGNGILAIGAFQYYLQFAHGKLKMHVIFNTISAIIQIPVIIYVAYKHGAMGVALAWFFLRLLIFIIWTPIVHRKFAPGMHGSWLIKDVIPAFLITFVLLMMLGLLNIEFIAMSRLEIFLTLFGIGFVILVANILFVSESRKFVFNMIKVIDIK